ncbi:hypothetical protein DFS34DRAFT_594915 [Phlyctochytrium arcticum]|nr:hypothetical protein DFS34DRAFT_594915 [Phlyctochytrium arcticum]
MAVHGTELFTMSAIHILLFWTLSTKAKSLNDYWHHIGIMAFIMDAIYGIVNPIYSTNYLQCTQDGGKIQILPNPPADFAVHADVWWAWATQSDGHSKTLSQLEPLPARSNPSNQLNSNVSVSMYGDYTSQILSSSRKAKLACLHQNTNR